MAQNLVCVDVYTVRAGDTLYTIAQNYGVSVVLLMRVNNICNPYNLRIGRKLCIPGDPSEIPARPTQPNQPTCDGTLYTVVAGDTLYMIAKRFEVSLNDIIRANPSIDPYDMRIGTNICIPNRPNR